MPRPRLIIDCDPGHDDAIALIVAHRHAEVVGITTVSGNAPLDATTANALMVTALLDAETPVHRGAPKPLVGEPAHAAAVHGESGLGGVARIAHQHRAASDDAVGFLLDAADEALWVVAVGPLTNLALALERDSSWGRRLAGISIMGGSTDIGNVTRVAEFNIFADPEAAERVFDCGARLTMCGLNLTRQLRSNDALAERLRRADSPLAQFAAQSFDDLHDRIEGLTGVREAALHDPCAVLAVTHPELIETRPRAVSVELEGKLTRGMTVVDQRPQPPDGSAARRGADAPTANVAYTIDADSAMAVILEALEEGGKG
ncbi:MAG: nucleoside hydrolase [Gammaproteobacteria bacterium]|nr:nucleoside hydrolase [Gammaproteobacteria bacterium]